MKTVEDFRREDVKKLFDRILKKDIIILKPTMIRVEENQCSDNSIVDLSFQKIEGALTKQYDFQEILSSGFVDAVYKVCSNTFKDEYQSLKNISLVDVIVRPIFSMANTDAKTDAKTDVIFRVRTKHHGISEFSSRSRSILYSGLVSMLNAFEFYMNCDKTFNTLKRVISDAEQRNRGDIKQRCISDLSVLTRVNTYV